MERFKALDIFRGMTICLMIIVNTPGDHDVTFAPLLHADWHGFTLTDLVFPSFLFAIGNALAFVKVKKWFNWSQSDVYSKIFKRTIILFLLGYTMYWLPFFKWDGTGSLNFIPFTETRILGVLQRIALCYFFASILVLKMNPRPLFILSSIILILYWIIMHFGGDYTLMNNAVLKMDTAVLGTGHLYMGEGVPFDPEGLLSTVPSIVNVIAGYLLGVYLMKNIPRYEQLAKIAMIGASLIFISYFWDHLMPVNKKLWTSSFVTLTTGLDLLIICIIMYLVDLINKPVNFKFFEIFGTNSLAIYLLSEYLAIFMNFFRVDDSSFYVWVYENGFSFLGPFIGSLVFALVFMMVCWLVAKWLYSRNILIKV